MKRMKRLVALLVALATIASLCVFSIPASAEDTAAETLASVTVTDEDILRIEKLEALGVIEASYDPAGYVTRRKMADIIVRYMNITPSANSDGTPFRDVTMKDSSFASICTLYNMGVISGDDQLRFNPDNYVTYDEALVFIINAIGHKMFAEREGGYPTGYHRVAIKHGMLKGLSMQKGTDPVHFPDLYKILEAALDAASVIPQYYGDGRVTYTLSETDTYLYATYGIRKYHGIVTGNENTKLTSPDSRLSDEQIEIDGQLYETPGYVYDYFLGYAVDYFVKVNSESDAEMLYIEEARNYNEVIKIDAEDILPGKTTSSRIYYTEDNEDKEYHVSFSTNYDVIYNKQCWTGYGNLANTIPANGYIEALDNNNDGAMDVLFVYEYQNVVVQSTDSFAESITDELTGNVFNVDSQDNEVKIYYTGETKKRAFINIKKDSVLSILMSKGDEKVITIYICNGIVNGKVVGYDSQLGYQIGEEWYETAYNYQNAANGGTDITIGLEGDFYLDMNGDIVIYKYAAPENDNSSIGVVAGIQLSESKYNPDVSLKIFDRSGAFSVNSLSKKVKIDGSRYDLENETGTYGRISAITALNGVISGNACTIPGTFIIKYTVAANGEITSIDTGAMGGVGNINTVTEDKTEKFLGRGDMLILNYHDGQENKIYTRVDKDSVIVFYTPTDDKIGEDDMYEIKNVSFAGERYYGPGQSYMPCSEYSVYSLGTTEIPMVDVIVCKTGSSTSAAPTANSSMGIITGTATASNELGEMLPKIYLNGEAGVVLAKTVTYWDSENTSGLEVESSTLISGSSPVLKNGVFVQYETNFEGEVDRITIIAEYTNGTLTPKTSWTAHDGHAHHTLGESSNSQTDNILFGEIIAYDADAKLIQVKLGSHTNAAFKATGSVYMYITNAGATPKVVSGKLSDVGVGDKFVAKIEDYFNLQTMFILR